MLGRGEFECGIVLVYHLSEKINSSLYEFLPNKIFGKEREREREREREFCHDKCHHHLSPMKMSRVEEFQRMQNTSFMKRTTRESKVFSDELMLSKRYENLGNNLVIQSQKI